MAAIITVDILGPMRRPWPERRHELPLASETSVASLLEQLGYGGAQARQLAVLVNGTRATLERVLVDKDAVTITMMISGG